MARTADVAIIGAGIQGCSAALHCRRRGLSVIVLEKDRAGRHASGVNAGGVRRLNRHPAEVPLSVAATAIWHGIKELLGDQNHLLRDRENAGYAYRGSRTEWESVKHAGNHGKIG